MNIAVVGAGFSGLLTAYLLQKKGFKVAVYERQSIIGGHCKRVESKDTKTNIGTLFSFDKNIKELLIELNVDYTEEFMYRKFVDENSNSIQHMTQDEVKTLISELKTLEHILNRYSQSLKTINYGEIPADLMIPFQDFNRKNNFSSIPQFLKPFLSSFGFGSIDHIQAYYVFRIFNLKIIYAFLQGDKVLKFTGGASEVIKGLSQNISDIRFSMEVKKIRELGNKVWIETAYSSEPFDRVFISTKLPDNVIENSYWNNLMKKIDTNPFIICAYEVENRDLVTTYFKKNLGKERTIQFFNISKCNNSTTLVAYAYGHLEKGIVDRITLDLEALHINVLRLITVKQWFIFPHLKYPNLTPNFYSNLSSKIDKEKISFIGSLISEPSINNLYLSVCDTVEKIALTST